MDVWSMNDEELEQAFREAKAELGEADDVYEEVEDLEQPIEDSDDDTSMDEIEDTEDEEVSETEEDTHDGESDAEEEEADEDEVDDVEEVQPVQRHKFKANGKEYEFTMEEMMTQFPKVFGQAMDYTRKTQALKPWRKTIDAIESAQLGQDDINLAIDVLKGDKGAIAEVLRKHKIDALDVDVDSKYEAKDYGRDEHALAIQDVIDDISRDEEYKVTNRILSKEWDDNSFREMTKDPELIKLLHVDVKSGVYNKVQAIAEKMKVYSGAKQSDLEYYKDAAKVYYNEMANEQARLMEAEKARVDRENRIAEKARIAEVKANQEKAKAVKDESAKRKAAAPTKKVVAGTKKAIDYLDDESYDEWYASIQNR